jgi:alkylation response protein AidB-like acyl-CoA dehydrogenase
LTPRQHEIVELAAEMADKFAERATVHDRENTFPFEDYDDMRASGYLNLTVPEELGGGGASLLDLVLAQERLAAGDGSIALAVNMHLSPVGQWASIWRRTKDPGLEQMLRGVAAGEIVWASLTSEPGIRNQMMDSNTIAERVEGGYRLNGHKIFCTNSAVATNCSITARYEDPERGPMLMVFRTATDDDALEFVQTWDTMGMRGTQSNDMKIMNLTLPDSALVHSLPVDHYDATVLRTVFAWGMPTFGCVYIGMAAGAMEMAKEVARKRGKERDPIVQREFGEMEILLESARAVLWRHCEDVLSGQLFEQLSVQEAQARAGLAKAIPCANAVAIMQKIPNVVGGMSYTRKLPFERIWRDVQAGPVMPDNNHQTWRICGASSLGVQLHPELDDTESGLDSRPKTPADDQAESAAETAGQRS